MAERVSVFVDGGSRGNPGNAALGGQFIHNGEVLYEFSRFLGVATNNEAEYNGLIDALSVAPEVLAKVSNPSQLIVHMDSKLVVEQVSGRWKIKEPRLRELAHQAQQKIAALSVPVLLQYVPRAQNSEADRLVNECLDDHAT